MNDDSIGVPALFSGMGYAAAERPARPLEHFERIELTLNPGDLLYVPTWWWHQIENAPGGFNAAVALRGPRSVVKALLRPTFATLGSTPDIARLFFDVIKGLARLRTGSFEDNFFPKGLQQATPTEL